jgi:hypothetical protein
MQGRAKEKYAEIKIKDQLWDFISNLVFEEHFTEFVKKVCLRNYLYKYFCIGLMIFLLLLTLGYS